ncbi:CGNR zinc finger domain-containing protein [Roseibium sp. SCP14]|uniref:CGNR zinc finger domain-containing protein n=1 Tax=Roseibium sp. SCP14 TaxID=3141375 RepID=UPI0033350D0D
MAYANGHPVRLIGGRLALDFVNTADWSKDGKVIHEKIETPEDLNIWLDTLELGPAMLPEDVNHLHRFRADIRSLLQGGQNTAALAPARQINPAGLDRGQAVVTGQPLEALIAISAMSILMDKRELERLKMCPAQDCGWLFIDETRNSRRRWCSMETCGNRAKANRHYARQKTTQNVKSG